MLNTPIYHAQDYYHIYFLGLILENYNLNAYLMHQLLPLTHIYHLHTILTCFSTKNYQGWGWGWGWARILLPLNTKL